MPSAVIAAAEGGDAAQPLKVMSIRTKGKKSKNKAPRLRSIARVAVDADLQEGMSGSSSPKRTTSEEVVGDKNDLENDREKDRLRGGEVTKIEEESGTEVKENDMNNAEKVKEEGGALAKWEEENREPDIGKIERPTLATSFAEKAFSPRNIYPPPPNI